MATTKPITIGFGQGVQKPAKLGTVILKPTANNRLAYAQNIQSESIENGEGLLVPGPALTTLGNNSELTGAPIAYTRNPFRRFIDIIEGGLGATDIIRRVWQVRNGITPELASGESIQITHDAHTGETITDTATTETADQTTYVVGKDSDDAWIFKYSDSGSVSDTDSLGSASLVSTLTGVSSSNSANVNPKIFRAPDNNFYISRFNIIDQLTPADAYNAAAFTLPTAYITSEMAVWNDLMAFAYVTGSQSDVTRRTEQSRSGILLWDLVAVANYVRDVPCPARFISAVIQKPDGNLIAFGSLDAGLTTIYLFTGYGFETVYSYIGEPPRNRHSVDFDAEGRMLWQTLNGQVCMYDFRTGKFEHITSVDADNGGIFTRLLGGSGNEWLIGSGKTGPTYNISRISYGSYIGDGDAGSDTFATPLAISGQEYLPPKSTITGITLQANRELKTGEKVELRVYKNGNLTPEDYLTMDFSSDGSKSAKREIKTITDVNNFSLGIAFKQADGLATALPVFSCVVEYEPTIMAV